VPLIYLDEKRSFGGALDDSGTRLAYYHSVIENAMRACRAACPADSIAAFKCLETFLGCS
jgi:hypothetical protein